MKNPITRRGVLVGAVAVAAVFTTIGRLAQANESTVHEVQITKFKFEPYHVAAKAGDVIRWTNNDLAPHTATGSEFAWDTGGVAQGESVEIVVTAEMEKRYFCAFHPHMKGEIEVE